jgi:hypothetical protein
MQKVRERINEFVAAKAWQHVATDPYILFDLVFEALYFEVDNTVWKMNTVFGPLEHASHPLPIWISCLTN